MKTIRFIKDYKGVTEPFKDCKVGDIHEASDNQALGLVHHGKAEYYEKELKVERQTKELKVNRKTK